MDLDQVVQFAVSSLCYRVLVINQESHSPARHPRSREHGLGDGGRVGILRDALDRLNGIGGGRGDPIDRGLDLGQGVKVAVSSL